MIEIGVDIGGTFTDLAVYDPAVGHMRFGKVRTTPEARRWTGLTHILERHAIAGW